MKIVRIASGVAVIFFGVFVLLWEIQQKNVWPFFFGISLIGAGLAIVVG